jgi:hypothetical protein
VASDLGTRRLTNQLKNGEIIADKSKATSNGITINSIDLTPQWKGQLLKYYNDSPRPFGSEH